MTEPVSPSCPMPRCPRYRSLDLWRGVSCLTIVAYHAALLMVRKEQAKGSALGSPFETWLLSALSYGWVAVPWFFVISGYCICATVDSTRRKPRAPLEYFKRRFRRIFPPYWAILGVTLLVFWVASSAGESHLFSNQDDVLVNPFRFTPAGWFGNITLTEIWRHHLFGAPGDLLVGQAWSLCYEEQFYVISGLILFLMPGRLFSGFAAVTAFSVVMMGLRALRVAPAFDGLFFDGKWVMFVTGVVVYHAINYSGPRLRSAVLALLCMGVVLPALPPLYSALKILAPSLIASSAFGAILLALHPFDERASRSRALQPFFFCGQMCYSMYLVHILVAFPISHALYDAGVRGLWPTLLVTVPLVTGLSVLLAWVFFLAVERHFLNASPRSLVSVPRIAPVLDAA